MHNECAVSRCGAPTQDRICQSHVDDLVATILSIVTNPNRDAPTVRLVVLHDKAVEMPVDHGGLWEDLDITLTRQHTTPRLERAGSRTGSPMLHHIGASEAKSHLEATVWYWVYYFHNANSHLDFNPFTATVVEACAWVAQFPGLIASLDAAEVMLEDFMRDVEAAARVVDLDPGRVYLGQCGSQLDIGRCEQHLYAPKGQRMGVCPWCGVGWFADERQALLVDRVRDESLGATDVARVLGQVGIVIAPSTIRNYALSKLVDGVKQPPKLRVAGKDERGNPQYRVGDVLDIFLHQTQRAA